MRIVGVLANRGADQCMAQWSATADYLNEKIPGHDFTILPLNFNEIYTSVAAKKVDFVLVNSSMYVEMQVKYQVNRMLTMKNATLDQTILDFGGVIFTTTDNTEINSLADLQNKKFAAVDKGSFGGWQVAWKEMQDQGINPDHYFAQINFQGTHDAVVMAVLDHQYDVGTVRTDTLERMRAEGKIELSKIKVINQKSDPNFPFLLSTNRYPEWPLAKTAHISSLLGHKVAGKKVELLFDIDNDLPFKLIGDVGKLTQVLTNLISNALKFTDQGNVILSVTAEILDDNRIKILF